MRRATAILAAAAMVVPVCMGPAQAEPPGRAWAPVETLTNPASPSSSPDVVVDALGHTTVVFQQDGWIKAIRKPRGGAWGTAVQVGRGTSPVVDADNAGTVTVAWWGARRSIRAARKVIGKAWTDPVVLQPGVSQAQGPRGALGPEIAVGPRGAVVVVWEWGSEDVDPTGWRIRAAYRPANARWQTLRDIVPVRLGAQDPVADVDRAGNVTVVVSATKGITAVRRAVGQGWKAPVRIGGTGEEPDVAMAPGGAAVAVWTSYRGAGSPVRAARRPAGGSWGTPVRISDAGIRGYSPQVEIDRDGRTLAAWARPSGWVEAARRPLSGGWRAPVLVSGPGEGDTFDPQLAMNRRGDALLVWTRYTDTVPGMDVWLQAAYRPESGPWGAAERVIPPGEGEPSEHAAGVAPNGSAVSVWDAYSGVGADAIHARWWTP